MPESFMNSPALKRLSDSWPMRFSQGIPRRVRMLMTVRSELPFGPRLTATIHGEYETLVNSHGAVSVLIDGKPFGVKPDEFAVTEWHPFPTEAA